MSQRYIKIDSFDEAHDNEIICAVYDNPINNITGTKYSPNIIQAMKNAREDNNCHLVVWRDDDNKAYFQYYDINGRLRENHSPIKTPKHKISAGNWVYDRQPTLKDAEANNSPYFLCITNENIRPQSLLFNFKGNKWFEMKDEISLISEPQVIAWMPMPYINYDYIKDHTKLIKF